MGLALPVGHAHLAVDLEASDGVQFANDGVEVASNRLEVVCLVHDHALFVDDEQAAIALQIGGGG